MNVIYFVITLTVVVVMVMAMLTFLYFDEKKVDKKKECNNQRIVMENDEFDYGHNVKHRSNDDGIY